MSAPTTTAPDFPDPFLKLLGCPPGPAPYEASALPTHLPAECAIVMQGKIIRDFGVGVTVPTYGLIAGNDSLFDQGSQSFAVQTNEDASLDLLDVGSEFVGNSDPCLGCPAACTDSFYLEGGYRETDRHRWTWNSRTAPVNQPSGEPQMSPDAVLRALRRGTANITHTENDCGMTDDVENTAAEFDHRFIASPQIAPNSNDCRSADSHNAVDFGDLGDPGPRATHCRWTFPRPGYDELTDADIRFNKEEYNWTVHPSGANCNNDYDIEDVMTHERGHTYGLKDLKASDHGNLTMGTGSSTFYDCQSQRRTLGRGDILGLREIYDD